MTNQPTAGIYLVVEFDWPSPFRTEDARRARALHDAVKGQGRIREVVAASHGIGDSPSSLWVFYLPSYAALDRLLRDSEDSVAKAYSAFFEEMPNVRSQVRQEVLFL
jgi:hypothetical protein